MPPPCRCTPACERFVDHQGLKYLFALFMGKAKVKGARKSKAKGAEREVGQEVRAFLFMSISLFDRFYFSDLDVWLLFHAEMGQYHPTSYD